MGKVRGRLSQYTSIVVGNVFQWQAGMAQPGSEVGQNWNAATAATTYCLAAVWHRKAPCNEVQYAQSPHLQILLKPQL